MTRLVRPLAAISLVLAAPAVAGPRETLAAAAFSAPSKDAALKQIAGVEAQAKARLTQAPNDRDAQMYRAIAIGYRAKLTKSKGDAETSRKMFELLARANPRDPEAQILIGGWHLDAVDQLGGMLAGAVLGAKRATGLAAVDRAVALGRAEAMFPALAALMRIRLDAGDVPTALALADRATKTPAPTSLDRLLQQQATALLVPLRAGDGKAAQKLARRLLPFGKLS